MNQAFEIKEAARAKINLALHVTGQRADGYHLLDSLVTFADFGDEVLLSASEHDRFEIHGQFSNALSSETDNLVTRARDRLRSLAQAADHPAFPAEIILTKNLPLSSGIGGGSADAAATLRGLMTLWKLELGTDQLSALALSLGADVPMCLTSRPLIARGIGDEIEPIGNLPSFPIVLINPLRPVSTPQIFKLLTSKTNAPMPDLTRGVQDWVHQLNDLRNDLQPPAVAILPEISECLDMLRTSGANVIRMSGSGATCFGLYRNAHEAADAAAYLKRGRPDWYVQAGSTIKGSET